MAHLSPSVLILEPSDKVWVKASKDTVRKGDYCILHMGTGDEGIGLGVVGTVDQLEELNRAINEAMVNLRAELHEEDKDENIC